MAKQDDIGELFEFVSQQKRRSQTLILSDILTAATYRKLVNP